MEWIKTILTQLHDPVYIVLLLVISFLLTIIIKLFKLVDKKDGQFTDVLKEVSAQSITLSKLAVLIEVLVNRRGVSKRED